MNATTAQASPTPVAVEAATEPAVVQRFTALDRCDTCNAQAYVGAMVNGTELIYCAHHARKYEERLRAVATEWHDETARLYEEQTRVGISA